MITTKNIDLGKKARSVSITFFASVIAAAVIFIGGFFLAINQMNLSFVYVSGSSMEPELKNGSVAVVKYDKLVEKGQVVVFNEPNKWRKYHGDESYDFSRIIEQNQGNPQTFFIKNITAIVSDELIVNNDGVFVNSEQVFSFPNNNYLCKNFSGGEEFRHVLTSKEVFVMGVNQETSFDSLRVLCNYSPSDAFLSNLDVSQHGEIVHVFSGATLFGEKTNRV